MSLIRPFRGLRPTPEKVAQVASVPYDVVNRSEAAALAKENPWSLLHVSRAEIDLPEDIHPYSDEVYSKAKLTFEKMIRDCPLVTEEQPALYLYSLKAANGHEQTGVVASFSIDEYDLNRIKKHEKTRKDKEDDRTRHIVTLNAQTGPVFLAYRGREEINQAVASVRGKNEPLFHFTAPDGVTHSLWKLADSQGWIEKFAQVESLYIADGHHRAASASRARAEKKRSNIQHTGKEDYNFFLAVAFPSSELKILPYNRVVKDLKGLSIQEFISQVQKQFEVAPSKNPHPGKTEFCMYLDHKWFKLKPKRIPQGLIESLDVSILQDQLLRPILGIEDPRVDQRIDFVGGIRGTQELEKLVDSGKSAVAFSMHPTTMEQLMAISDSGEIMPPKSTWFEPKLRDGLVSHRI